MNGTLAIALIFILTSPAFRQTANRPQVGSDAPLIWSPIAIKHADALPKATVPKPILTKLKISDFTVSLEETELKAVQARFGGEIGHEGDASESLGWLCLHGGDGAERWVLWLESGETDGPTVGGFQWRRVPETAHFDTRCQELPDGDSKVNLPIELRLNSRETKLLQVLGQPSMRKGDTLIYEHEHDEPIHGEPYTFTNRVVVVLRHGAVWAIDVDESTLN
jgi:hypothetical protein